MLSVVNSPNGTGVRGTHPGRPGRRQDRDRPDRVGRHRNLVRRFRPRPRPADRRRRAGGEPAAADEYQGGTIAAPIAKAIIQAYLQPGERTDSRDGAPHVARPAARTGTTYQP